MGRGRARERERERERGEGRGARAEGRGPRGETQTETETQTQTHTQTETQTETLRTGTETETNLEPPLRLDVQLVALQPQAVRHLRPERDEEEVRENSEKQRGPRYNDREGQQRGTGITIAGRVSWNFGRVPAVHTAASSHWSLSPLSYIFTHMRAGWPLEQDAVSKTTLQVRQY